MRYNKDRAFPDDLRKSRWTAPVIFMLLVLLLLAGTGFWVRDRFFASAPNSGAPLSIPGPRVLMNGELLGTGHRPRVRDGTAWMRIETVRENIDPYVWLDAADGQITFTTGSRIIRMHAGSREAMDGGRKLVLSSEPVLEDGIVWLPADFLSGFYNLDIRLMSFNGNVRVDGKNSSSEVRLPGTASSAASKPADASSGTSESADASPGVSESFDDSSVAGTIPSWKPSKGKLSLAWEMMYAPNSRYLDRKPSSGLDVLAPTWFSLSGGNDAIAVRASEDYVKWAHGNGYKVWALFANKFDDIEGTSELMHDPDRRQAVIETMLGYARQFGLDGINLDFENMYREDSGYYTQFVREFAAVLRPEGLILSVDVSVPEGSDTWSRCFDRKALSESADCIFLMAYDQHYAGGSESGSTAEIGWVEDRLKATLEEVPAQKLLLGIPLFSRVWRETDAAGNPDVGVVNALGVNTAWQRVRENGAEPVWDEELGQYSARFADDEGTYSIWLEDWNAVNMKTSLALRYGLAGVGAWSINYADDRDWDIIGRNLKETADYEAWLASLGPSPRYVPLPGK